MKASHYTKETIRSIGVSEIDFPDFNIGDTINVSVKIKEGNKERLQAFIGDVIAMKKNGASSTFTVRKLAANSISVERIFPFYSPAIDSISLVRKGSVRRAKLYYLRDRIGKAARIKEKVLTKEQEKIEKEKSAARRKAAKDGASKVVVAKKEASVAKGKEAVSEKKEAKTGSVKAKKPETVKESADKKK